MNKKYLSLALGVTTGIVMIVPAFAENTPTQNNGIRENNSNRMMMRGGENEGRGNRKGQTIARPIAGGKVTAISGNIITISGHQGKSKIGDPLTTFTVDGTNAKIMKNDTVGTVASIIVGDTIMIQGTVSGTNIVATAITSGNAGDRNAMKNDAMRNDMKNKQVMEGNGQPVIAGTVTSITGTTITLTNKSNITYAIETKAAKIVVAGATSTLAQVKTGDSIIVQGAMNGTSVTASTVFDHGIPKTALVNTAQGNNENRKERKEGFFSAFSGFFGKMFGF